MIRTGVYILRNLVNNRIYIGSTRKSFSDRWSAHRMDLVNNRHANEYLQRSWNKYGSNSFSFEVLERCLREHCLEREQYWINFHEAYIRDKGFNINELVTGRGKWKLSSKLKVSKTRIGSKRPGVTLALKGKRKPSIFVPVEQWKDGEFIKVWPSATDVRISLGIIATNIGTTAQGKRPSAGGFQWKFQKLKI